jgi:ABC-type antimicrobial peptide transport system permease subunit
LKQAVLDMTVGIAIGVPSALALSSIMANLLYGVTPTDPIAFVLAAPVLVAVAAASTFMPVRRALAIDPSEALRLG